MNPENKEGDLAFIGKRPGLEKVCHNQSPLAEAQVQSREVGWVASVSDWLGCRWAERSVLLPTGR